MKKILGILLALTMVFAMVCTAFAEGGSVYWLNFKPELDEDAQALATLVENGFPKMDGKVEIFPIGATIGCHTGPGTVALFFWGGPRV